MKAKHEAMSRELLFYCFVDFGRSLNDLPKCWVLPSAIVAKTLATAHKAWLATPGMGGRLHQDHDMRRLLLHYPYPLLAHDSAFTRGWLDSYAENWALIAAPTRD